MENKDGKRLDLGDRGGILRRMNKGMTWYDMKYCL